MGNKHPPKVHMIRITELKLPLADVPFEQRRAANAPAETEADRQLRSEEHTSELQSH